MQKKTRIFIFPTGPIIFSASGFKMIGTSFLCKSLYLHKGIHFVIKGIASKITNSSMESNVWNTVASFHCWKFCNWTSKIIVTSHVFVHKSKHNLSNLNELSLSSVIAICFPMKIHRYTLNLTVNDAGTFRRTRKLLERGGYQVFFQKKKTISKVKQQQKT